MNQHDQLRNAQAIGSQARHDPLSFHATAEDVSVLRSPESPLKDDSMIVFRVRIVSSRFEPL